MSNELSINDISIYTNRQIQDVYNESIMNIFIEESNYFKDVILNRNINESVLFIRS